MSLQIGARTSRVSRIFLYCCCLVLGAYGAMQLDTGWAATQGTAEYARYAFWFNTVWVFIWGALSTAVVTLAIWVGSRIAYNCTPTPANPPALTVEEHKAWWQRYQKWEAAVLAARRLFACFAFGMLGAFAVALALSSAAPPTPSAGLCLLLVALYLANKKD